MGPNFSKFRGRIVVAKSEPACFLFSYSPSHLAADKFLFSLFLFVTNFLLQALPDCTSITSFQTRLSLLVHLFVSSESSTFITMPFTPVALFGLEVPAGDILVPATMSSRATVSTFTTASILLRIGSQTLLWLTTNLARFN